MKYTNPIIPGFYPDPSICRKGEDYYLVTSSFEFFPGVPIFHSTDLVNWTQIGHCLNRKSQLDLDGIDSSRGIYAPTIRYNPHDDLFYMVTTNVTRLGNFYVYAKDPAGDWSEPIPVKQGGIDPSLFFDDDGSAHFISNDRDRGRPLAGFKMAPINLATGELQEYREVWGGTGGHSPEAPHIYKANGWYYQLIAEGGTELGHMVTIARSRELYGPYEACPFNPILTHKNMKGHPVQATGHADLIEDGNGHWWAVFLGYRQTHQYFHHLGRETFLAPVEWRGEWPVINGGRPIELEMEVAGSAVQHKRAAYETDFYNGLDLNWVYLRNPNAEDSRTGADGLILRGNRNNLSDIANPAFLGYRQKDLNSAVTVDLEFSPLYDYEEAGVSVFYKHDAHMDAYIVRENGANLLCLRKVVGEIRHIELRLPLNTEGVTVKIVSDKLKYRFYAVICGAEVFLGEGLTRHVSTEAHELGFTGTFYALYATGNGKVCEAEARFTGFRYEGSDSI